MRWIVDPLDGTVNYLYGLADWSVSIAAELDGTVVAGVVTAPALGEVFTATLGGGAWLHAGDGPPVALRCNTGVPLDQALVSTGFGYAVAAARRAGPGGRRPAAPGAGHQARWLVRRGPVLAGGWPGGRLLRARA